MSSFFLNPNGPPPKFPTSPVNPGPQSQEDWDRFIRWLLLFWQQNQTVNQSVQSQQQLPTQPPFPIEAPKYLTFVFDATYPGIQTANYEIQFPKATGPLVANITAVRGPQISPAYVDLQTSPDLVTWTSILTTPLALPLNALSTSPVTLFAPSAQLRPGCFIRGYIPATSDLTALQISVGLLVS